MRYISDNRQLFTAEHWNDTDYIINWAIRHENRRVLSQMSHYHPLGLTLDELIYISAMDIKINVRDRYNTRQILLVFW